MPGVDFCVEFRVTLLPTWWNCVWDLRLI